MITGGAVVGVFSLLDSLEVERRASTQNLLFPRDANLVTRGRLLSELFRLRNTVFGIDARSKRPLREATYTRSMAAIRELAKAASTNGATVLLYIPPLRTDVEPPYIASEYSRFQHDVEALAEDEKALFANFGDVVPGPLWGMIAAANVGGKPDYDFMHFQRRGHVLFADAVEATLVKHVPELLE